MGSVLSGIKVTLYDVFGYLLPGLVVLTGVATLFWAYYVLPNDRSLAMANLNIQTWSLLLVAAYVLGHMAQALGNVIENLIPSVEKSVLGEQDNSKQGKSTHDHGNTSHQMKERVAVWKKRVIVWFLGEQEAMPTALRDKAEGKAREMLGDPPYDDDMPKDDRAKWLYRICDEALAQRGQVQDREVYTYREGFYRALTIAFFLLCISFLASAGQTTSREVSVASPNVQFGQPEFLIFAGVSAVGAWLAYRRYVHFGCYRVRQAVTGFLVLKEDIQTADLDKSTTPSKVESLDSTIVVIEGKADWRLRRLFRYLR